MLEKNTAWDLLSLLLLITASGVQANYIPESRLNDYHYLMAASNRLSNMKCICKGKLRCYTCRKAEYIAIQLIKVNQKPDLLPNGIPSSPYVPLTSYKHLIK